MTEEALAICRRIGRSASANEENPTKYYRYKALPRRWRPLLLPATVRFRPEECASISGALELRHRANGNAGGSGAIILAMAAAVGRETPGATASLSFKVIFQGAQIRRRHGLALERRTAGNGVWKRVAPRL